MTLVQLLSIFFGISKLLNHGTWDDIFHTFQLNCQGWTWDGLIMLSSFILGKKTFNCHISLIQQGQYYVPGSILPVHGQTLVGGVWDRSQLREWNVHWRGPPWSSENPKVFIICLPSTDWFVTCLTFVSMLIVDCQWINCHRPSCSSVRWTSSNFGIQGKHYSYIMCWNNASWFRDSSAFNHWYLKIVDSTSFPPRYFPSLQRVHRRGRPLSNMWASIFLTKNRLMSIWIHRWGILPSHRTTGQAWRAFLSLWHIHGGRPSYALVVYMSSCCRLPKPQGIPTCPLLALWWRLGDIIRGSRKFLWLQAYYFMGIMAVAMAHVRQCLQPYLSYMLSVDSIWWREVLMYVSIMDGHSWSYLTHPSLWNLKVGRC